MTLVIAVAVVRPAFAQPAENTPAPGEDAALYSCHKHSGAVAVTFKPETELKDLITWVMGFTCKNFILDPRIVSTGRKVTVIAPVKMSQQDAYRVFLVALSTMGLTVVPKGNVLRIVESAQAKSDTLPILKKGVPADDDQMVRYVLRPSYAQVETLRSALDSVRSQAGSVQVAGSMLIITDYASQVRDMMSLAKLIDVPGNNEGIYTIPVKYADATQLQQKLSEILGVSNSPGGAPGGMSAPPIRYVNGRPMAGKPAGEGGGEASDDTGVPSKILVDERTNTLIVVASEAGYARVKSLVDRLDIVLDTEGGSAIRVYPLQNALAKDLAKTLNAALQGAGQRQGGAPGRPGAPPVAPSGSMAGLDTLEGQVRVVSDDPTNSLIIMSSGRDYLAIRDVIRKLDQPRRQIFIEALILEVQLSKETDLGTSAHGGLPTDNGQALVLGGVQSANGPNSLSPASLASLSGLIGGIIGSPLTQSQTFLGTSIPSYGVLFQALATQANTNILSAPHIIAIDNEEAKFSVGNNIPYQAGLSFGGVGLPGAAGAAGAAGAGGLPLGAIGQNIQRESLNLELNVTPHISSNDAVRLEIEQNTKDEGEKDPQLGPTWTERKLKTQVVVHDQETVVIGGLIQEREIYNTSKVPLLGDIPLLGYLFKYTTKTKKKTNLLIMLTPYIIKDQLDLEAIRERKEREYHEFTASFAYLNEAKYEPHIDYRRKRGLIEEINRAVEAVEEDKAEKAALDAANHHVQEGAVDVAPSTIESPDDNPSGGGGK